MKLSVSSIYVAECCATDMHTRVKSLFQEWVAGGWVAGAPASATVPWSFYALNMCFAWTL